MASERSDYYGKPFTFHERAGIETDIGRWKQQSTAMHGNNNPKTANDALTQCFLRFYPAVRKILTTLLTVPIGSVSCEKLFHGL